MKKILLFVVAVLLLFCTPKAISQVVVHSSNGYSVNVVITPKAIVTYSSSCTWGYTYNVRIDYAITFTGNNKPSSLYTLQATLNCGSSSHFISLPRTQGSGTTTSQSYVWRSVSDCATANVTSLLCNTATLEISGPGINYQLVPFVVNLSPLPVKLSQFSAEALKTKVQLNWQTETEINSDHFAIERSTDGNNWTTIQTIRAAGNSVSSVAYTAFDESPLPGVSQYRIRVVNIDGSSDFSATRIIKFNGNSTVGLYPTPNNGNTIYFTGLSDPAHTKITVVSMAGSIVAEQQLTNSSAVLPGINAGVYVIRWINSVTGETGNIRYVKL